MPSALLPSACKLAAVAVFQILEEMHLLVVALISVCIQLHPHIHSRSKLISSKTHIMYISGFSCTDSFL